MQFATESWNGRAIVLGGADQSARGRGVYAVPWGQPATLRLRPFLAVCNGSRGGGVCDVGWNTLRGGGEPQASLSSVLCFGLRGGYVLRLCTRAPGKPAEVLHDTLAGREQFVRATGWPAS